MKHTFLLTVHTSGNYATEDVIEDLKKAIFNMEGQEHLKNTNADSTSITCPEIKVIPYSSDIPLVQFNIKDIDVQFDISTGRFRVFNKPKDEFLKTLVRDSRLGATYWDDPASGIRVGAFAKIGSADEQRFVYPDRVDHWVCFCYDRADLIKLLHDAF